MFMLCECVKGLKKLIDYDLPWDWDIMSGLFLENTTLWKVLEVSATIRKDIWNKRNTSIVAQLISTAQSRGMRCNRRVISLRDSSRGRLLNPNELSESIFTEVNLTMGEVPAFKTSLVNYL